MANVFGGGKTIKQICMAGGIKYSRPLSYKFGRALRKAGVVPTGHNGQMLLWEQESALRVFTAMQTVQTTSKVPDVIDLRRRVDALEKTVTDLRTALGG